MHDTFSNTFAKDAQATAMKPIDFGFRFILRCREKDIDAVSTRLGVALPRQACRSAQTGPLNALWLGPDEWLLLSSDTTENAAHTVAGKLDGMLCSIVDVSHRQIAFGIEGPECEALLASGCALDLDISKFPVGMCTRTMFHKAEIVLWRTGPTAFHLEVWRSFARYVEALLFKARAEF